MSMRRLGAPRLRSPLPTKRFVEHERVLQHALESEVRAEFERGRLAGWEAAGPRREIYFPPEESAAAIVTCGGLCPGINDVIRAIYMQLYHGYGMRRIYGIPYGYQGLNPAFGHEPIVLHHDDVDDIHQHGGSVLHSSRGPQDVGTMVDFLQQRRIDMLFAIGGDGTQRGALALASEIERRGLSIAIVGIPKSIDNDLACIEKTFGFETAVAESRTAISCAHNEAKGAPNGVGIVKLMGRESGFIAAWASLAFSEVNLTLVPEVPFRLHGEGQVLAYVEDRLRSRRHCVIVVAEGAGQDLFADGALGRDASGNRRLGDVGALLQREIKAHMQQVGLDLNLKYIDPSYIIRSVPAIADDSVYCLRLGQCAADAAMAGYTGLLIGSWNGNYTHVPLTEATRERRTVDPDGWVWQAVLRATGQPDWR